MRSTAIPTIVAFAAGACLVACSAGSTSSPTSPPSSRPSGGGGTATTTVTARTTASSAPSSGSSSSTSSSAPSPRGSAAPAGPAGGPVPTGFRPVSVTNISTSTSWVLGTAPCPSDPCTSIVRTRDAGHSWVGLPAPRAGLDVPGQTSTTGFVSGLRFADQLDGWAYGNALYSTHDGGAHWTKQQLGASNDQVRAVATADGYVWALGELCRVGAEGCTQANDILYRSPIGRDAWRAVTDLGGDTRGSSTVPDRLVVRGNQAWVLMGSVIRTSTGGQDTALATPCTTSGFRVAAFAVADANHLDAVCSGLGGGGSAAQQLVGTTDGGRSWRSAGPQRREPSFITGLADNQHGVLLEAAVSGGSTVLRSVDDGGHVAGVLSPNATGGLPYADLGFTDPSHAVVVLVKKYVYLSSDAGAHFSAVTIH